MYDTVGVGGTAFMVSPTYKDDRARIEVGLWIKPGHQATSESWNMRLTSLVDPEIQVSILLDFSVDCTERRVKYCPLPSQPKTLLGPERALPGFAFLARVVIPPEFVGGFLLELPEVSDGSSKLEAKPLKFELRRDTLVWGTLGC
jgi:hypothetical protein